MDEIQRQKIRKLRSQGYGYLRISTLLEISPNTIRSFCKKENIAGYINSGEQLRGKDNLQVCKQCGEVSYSNEVAKQLEKLVNSVRNAITEITVINYTEKVA